MFSVTSYQDVEGVVTNVLMAPLSWWRVKRYQHGYDVVIKLLSEMLLTCL